MQMDHRVAKKTSKCLFSSLTTFQIAKSMKFIQYSLLLLFILLPIVASGAADNPRDRLDKLRAEIDSLESVLEKKQSGKKGLLSQLTTQDEKIAARRKLINELKAQHRSETSAVRKYDREITKEEKNLIQARRGLEIASAEVDELEDLVKRRAVYVYKRGVRESLRFLAAAENPGDLLRRRAYINKIHNRDKTNLENLRNAQERKENQKNQLDRSIKNLSESRAERAQSANRISLLIDERQIEKGKLEKERKKIDELLVALKKDEKFLESIIGQRKKAADEVKNWIASLERNRVSGDVQELVITPPSGAEIIVRSVKKFRSFSDAKGRLPWPVSGKVVGKYGLQKNLSTGTLTDNPGIEISAHEGTEIIAVQSGVCKRITYLRWFGTTMLIEHDAGYYTVYAHLGDIWVNEGEKVEAGRVIGTVGTSGAVETPRLHFEVWHKQAKQDPLKWLSS